MKITYWFSIIFLDDSFGSARTSVNANSLVKKITSKVKNAIVVFYLATFTTLVSGDEGTIASVVLETTSGAATTLSIATLGGLPLFRLLTTLTAAVGFPWASTFGGLPRPLFLVSSTTTLSPVMFVKN